MLFFYTQNLKKSTLHLKIISEFIKRSRIVQINYFSCINCKMYQNAYN